MSQQRLLSTTMILRSRTLCFIACALLAGAAVAFVQRDFDQVEIRAQLVGENPAGGKIHVLTGMGGNIGVSVGTDGVAIVDSQFLPLADKIQAALERVAGGEVKAVRYLVNTHWHGDHTGGNPRFAHTHATTAIAHANVRKRLAGDASIPGRRQEDFDPAGLPDVTYEDGLSVWLNGEEVRLLHFPSSHTDGDTVVHFTGAKVAHLGDLYFQVGFPFVDHDSGGSVRGLLASLDRLLELLPPDTRLVPGHGVVTGLEELRAYRVMIAECLARVERARAAGKGLAEMNAENLLGDLAERWAWEFISAERFLAILHTELSRN